MFGIQGGNKNSKKETIVPKNEVVKNKEVIAEYDEALVKENKEREEPLGKLEQLKQKLGLGEDSFDNSEIKTNLIDSNDVATFIDWKSAMTLFLSYLVILILFIGGSFYYLDFMENVERGKANIYDEDILNTAQSIQREEALVESGLDLQLKIRAVEYLIDKHIYWTNFFDFIEKNTLKSVFYAGFTGDTGTDFSFNATADKNYFNATEQIKIFEENKYVKEVQVSNFIFSDDENTPNVKFTLNMQVDPNILYKN